MLGVLLFCQGWDISTHGCFFIRNKFDVSTIIMNFIEYVYTNEFHRTIKIFRSDFGGE